MAGKGAPAGNTNAKKETTGRRLVVYLTADDIQLLRYVLEKYGHDDLSDSACLDLARKAAKAGINNLLNPEYYEVATKRLIVPKEKRAMQKLEWNHTTGRYQADFDGHLVEVDGDVFAESEQEMRQTYIEQGMSEDDAEQKAYNDLVAVSLWTPDMHGVSIDGKSQSE